ncbi:uncharacterized protein LOC129220262 [Uloborus diversus]|uniref:uncharacterized protein LOC129220262 n=1 Tax=Uloborus diversus TaxID=327109 RepID=UPI00240A27E9|nr:uncharacterized protein LOC129220262 [Uloborus diversus]
MLHDLLAIICYLAVHTTVTGAYFPACDPGKYICAGSCPALPDGIQLSEGKAAICLRDTESDACVCWLRNPSKQLNTVFQCTAIVNGTESQVLCQAPNYCFHPHPEPTCLIVTPCPCLEHNTGSASSYFGSWRPVKALILTGIKTEEQDDSPVEKVTGDIREFSLKHLLFLVAFVIAPLFCWCLLNFFHEGKCRKKSPQPPPEAQPIPTARGSTVDNMNNEDGDHQQTPSCPLSISSRSASVTSQRVIPPDGAPTAPEEVAVVVCAAAEPQNVVKWESPPSYFDTPDSRGPVDYGPPPSYEDAVLGPNANGPHLWQTVYVVPSGPQDHV